MEIFGVGGSVRDKLLGIEPKDFDYVVVGSSREEMLDLGFREVGRDFPVFIDVNGEEYALARQERLSNNTFEFSTDAITLEQDLLRRDLTINAIAMDAQGNLIDPYGGCKDIAMRVLRPVSEAFKEDPLRALRVARLKASLGGDWVIHHDLKEMVWCMKDKYSNIPKERVYKELVKALQVEKPSVFFKALDEMHILNDFFPEIYLMLSVEHDNPYHLEGSVFNHTMLVLDKCTTIPAKIAALFHDVGKYPCKKTLGTFHGHSDEQWVKPEFERMRKTYGFSSVDWKVAEYVALNHHRWQCAIDGTMGVKKFLKLLLGIRDSQFMLHVLDTIYADMEGRFGIKKVQKYNRTNVFNLWHSVRFHHTDCTGLSVDQIKEKVWREKLNLLKELTNGI